MRSVRNLKNLKDARGACRNLSQLVPTWGQLGSTWANLGPTWGQVGPQVGARWPSWPSCINIDDTSMLMMASTSMLMQHDPSTWSKLMGLCWFFLAVLSGGLCRRPMAKLAYAWLGKFSLPLAIANSYLPLSSISSIEESRSERASPAPRGRGPIFIKFNGLRFCRRPFIIRRN